MDQKLRKRGGGEESIGVSEFSIRLQKLREERTPIKARCVVSELCGLPPDAVRRYERGEAKPTLDALVKLADYYEVSLDYLVGRAPYR